MLDGVVNVRLQNIGKLYIRYRTSYFYEISYDTRIYSNGFCFSQTSIRERKEDLKSSNFVTEDVGFKYSRSVK